MRKMNKIIGLTILLLMLFLNLSDLHAQSKDNLSDDQKKEIKKQMEANEERLNLNEDQKNSYRRINRKYGKMARVVRDEETERTAKKEKLEKIRDDRNGEMKVLLSADQYKIYQEIEAERQEQMKQKARKRKS